MSESLYFNILPYEVKQLLLLYISADTFPAIFDMPVFSSVINNLQFWKFFLKRRYPRDYIEDMPVYYYKSKSLLNLTKDIGPKNDTDMTSRWMDDERYKAVMNVIRDHEREVARLKNDINQLQNSVRHLPQDYIDQLHRNQLLSRHWKTNSGYPADISLASKLLYQYNVTTEPPHQYFKIPLSPEYMTATIDESEANENYIMSFSPTELLDELKRIFGQPMKAGYLIGFTTRQPFRIPNILIYIYVKKYNIITDERELGVDYSYNENLTDRNFPNELLENVRNHAMTGNRFRDLYKLGFSVKNSDIYPDAK